MEKSLRGACGVETVRDLYNKRAEVHFLFKPATAHFLMRTCIGFSAGKHCESTEEERGGDTEEASTRKGISHERTFSPTSTWSEMCNRLEDMTMILAKDMRERHLKPKTVTLKVKLANFDILTRATTRDVALFQNFNNRQSSQDLTDIVITMLKEAKREHDTSAKNKMAPPGPSAFSVRLLGVRCSNFQIQKDNQSSLDRYRSVVHVNNADEQPPSLSASYSKTSNTMIKNPYISPKRVESKAKQSLTNFKHTPLQLFPKPSCTKAMAIPSTSAAGKIIDQIQCPICQKHFPTNTHDNAEINAHIDACLSATTVKELVKEETQWAEEKTKKKKRRLADFFS